MPKTILVPLDGSAFAERALPYAQVLAREDGARILLVRAVAAGYGLPGREAAEQEMDEARNELIHVAARLKGQGLQAEWLRLNDEPTWGIATVAKDEGADLIVMTTHGRSGLGRWVYGSVAGRLLHAVDAPILLVPRRATFNWPSPPALLRTVVPLDGSLAAEAALELIAEMDPVARGEVLLTRAIRPGAAAPDASIPEDPIAAEEDARAQLAPVASRMAGRDVQCAVYVGEGAPEEVVLDAVYDHRAHLIVMATHAREGVSRVVLGSVADKVLRQSPVPVLLVRIKEPAASAWALTNGTEEDHAPTVDPHVAVLMTPDEVAATAQALEAHLYREGANSPSGSVIRGLLHRLSMVTHGV